MPRRPDYRARASSQAEEAAKALEAAAAELGNLQGPTIKQLIRACQEGCELASALVERIRLEGERV